MMGNNLNAGCTEIKKATPKWNQINEEVRPNRM